MLPHQKGQNRKDKVFANSYQSTTQRQDRSYYQRLYQFNLDVELAEYHLPFESDPALVLGDAANQNQQKSANAPGMVNTTQLPPLEGGQSQQQYGYDQNGNPVQMMYDMDGNLVQMDPEMAEAYGQEMDPDMEDEMMEAERQAQAQQHHQDMEGQGEDDFKFDDLKRLLEKEEKEEKDETIAMRQANYIGKGTPIHKLLMEIKTGEQAISFFAKHGSNMPIKFLNCNRRKVHRSEFRPYDLVVAPYTTDVKHLDNEYYTISAQGVVQVFQDKKGMLISHIKKNRDLVPTEFLSLPDWMQQSTMFNVLTSMKFFKYYLIGKVFRLWKGNVRYRMFNRTRQDLSKNLIYARPDFQHEFLEINKILFEMQSKLTYNVEKKQTTVEIEKFMESQRFHHEDAKTHYKNKVEEEIKNTLVSLTKKVGESRTLREEEDLENAKKGRAEKKKSITTQKEEKNLKNQVLRLARQNYKSLGTFIRLIDYRVVETQVRINQESADFILKEMDNDAKKYSIQTLVDFDDNYQIKFHPNVDTFVDQFQKLLSDMRSATEDLMPINSQTDLTQFINGLITDNAPRFQIIVDDSYQYNLTVATIEKRLKDDFVQFEALTKDFEKCKDVQIFQKSFVFEKFQAEADGSLDMIRAKFEELHTYNSDITKYIKVSEQLGLITVVGRQLRESLQKKVKQEQSALRVYLFALAEQSFKVITTSLDSIKQQLEKTFDGLNQYVAYVKSLKAAKQTLEDLEKQKTELEQMKVVLQKFREEKGTSNFGNSNVSQLQTKIEVINQDLTNRKREVDEATERATLQKEANVEALGKRIEEVKEGLELCVQNVETPTTMSRKLEDKEDALKELASLKKKYDGLKEKINQFQEWEEILGVSRAEIPQIEIYEAKYAKRLTLWTNRDEFSRLRHKWYTENYKDQDAEEIVQIMTTYRKANNDMKLKLPQGEKDEVLEAFTDEVNDVIQHKDLFVAFGNKSMQPRHWKAVGQILNTTISLDLGLTFHRLIADGAENFKDEIEEVSGAASGEAQIEAQMDQIADRWDETYFTVANYRDTKDRYIIKEVEEVITLLEDDLLIVSTMMGSKHVKVIQSKVEDWEKKLGYISDLIEEKMTFQRQWMYLENIFNAEDIQAQLKAETKQFQQVDKFWKEHMNKIKKEPKVMLQADGGQIMKKLTDNNQRLEEIQKGLEDYLGTKRAAFPRFYFLSNDDLIEILSQTRNVHAVQPHLSKCFDNIKKIQFSEEKGSKEILGMFSSENEYVAFSQSVMAEGPVEVWLKNIESMMTQSLFDLTKRAFEEYPEDVTKRDKWLFDYPAQPVLTMDMVMWTSGVTAAIKEIMSGVSDSALKEWREITNQQLIAMINLVRGKLEPLQRAAMGALIVLDVHAQFVVDIMIKAQINNINDFNWTSQLRYYWEKIEETDGEPYRGDNTDFDCFCKQTNTRFRYGYEYLGNGPRLVITPLTDKCYMTLTGALHLNYGGNPQGPAGTGKTETTKDLAKALAIQCVVFNCSDGLDANMMARFFTGLASGGAWSCFDEFNRIFIEVLSVIAQQILTIQSAVKARLSEFDFEGQRIPLNLRFGVFITMNPGYAGRTELPDNLKALFRPISMMIPDYQLIAQIILFSEGFTQARPLSQKMVKLYSLSSEQLSKQDHYDFGMRAVKSVLVMAGKLRRKDDTVPEDILLIRAMRDSNVPKFLEQDLPLFRGIIQDLFPGVQVPFFQYELLENAIRKELEKENLIWVDTFKVKIIQLLETMTVRHGNMLVGSTGVGKTTCSRILGQALTSLYNEGHDEDPWHRPVEIKTLNPKAVMMGELFGEVNAFTNEWTEGIVSKLVKDAVNELEGQNAHWKRWVNFDGPVDALWIENMNTVLDDNKMLCLNNGQRIRMPDTCTMMFEVNDLKVASPATVSRCGMVFLEPVHLGWKPLIESWKLKAANFINNEYIEFIITTVMAFINKLLPKVRTYKEAIPSVDNNLVASCLRLIQLFLNKDRIKLEDKEMDSNRVITNYVAFSVVWSIGANVHHEDRSKFSFHMRSELKEHENDFMGEIDVFEQGIDPKTHKFQKWEEQINEHFEYNPKQSFFDILVPTSDTVKYKFLVDKIVTNSHNVLILGETGVGKSVIVKNYLMNGPEKIVSAFINFSGKTSTKNLVDAVEGNLDAPRKNLLQPKAGKKMIFFIDDVNMPQLDRYFSQPPCELLRQIIDQGGYYDTKKLFFKQVANTRFVCACAPPSGGRNPVSPRLFRHFNMIWIPDLSSQSMRLIFSSILRGFLQGNQTDNLHVQSDSIIKTSVEIYNFALKTFLPTPTKSHYTFNLRDLSKVVQGMIMCNIKDIEDSEYLIKLYICETYRVFRDRLIDDDDRQKFTDEAQKRMDENLNTEDWEQADYKNILFGTFESPDGRYKKLSPAADLMGRLQVLLDTYNDNNSPMDLVFFEDCIQHLGRIARILKSERGNAMLVGVGGSGRQSMARLAASFYDMNTFSIEITKSYKEKEFHEDIKTLLRNCAVDGDSPVQFLFSDTQIVKESFLEDINNLLNSGEIPNLFPPEEKIQIIDDLADRAKEAKKNNSREQIYSYFVELCRERLHIVLAFSPVGEGFRNRCRQFPSIINCATIDWYNTWPADALFSVAYRKFEEKQDALGISEALKTLSECTVTLHTSVREESENFYAELRRNNYVTPTSYLALVSVFLKELKNQRDLIPVQIQRYQSGLTRLAETNVIVDQLKEDLIKLKPEIASKEKETQEMVITIQDKTKIAAEKEKITSKEEAEAKVLFNEVNGFKQECETILGEAMPALESAVAALDTLKESDIGEMKGYKVPPEDLVLVLNAVMLLTGQKQDWDTAKKQMGNPKSFVQSLKNYKKDDMKDALCKKLKKFVNDPRFVPSSIKSKSVAGYSICLWVRAMDKYSEVKKIVTPKQAALKKAEGELAVVKKQLAEKQQALSAIKKELSDLQAQYSASQQLLDSLSRQKKQIELKLERANKLVIGLADESKRWQESIEKLNGDSKNMLGNTVLAAGFLSYTGCFTQKYRMKLLRRWQKFLREKDLGFSPDFTIQSFLGDPVKIRQWSIQGLPADELSIDNGIIATYPESRWPLIIDPQTQGNKWIKSKEKDNNLRVIKLSNPKFLNITETAIKLGYSVLLENIGETLDPSLEPVLQKNIFKYNNQPHIKLGDQNVPYHSDFLFFMTTKMANPHYLPEICIKVTLINFTVTPEGLEDQLLVEVIKVERPELEEERDKLVVSLAEYKRQLKNIEARILKLVAEASEDILEDEELIQTLDMSKQTSIAVGQKMEDSERAAIQINENRENYRPVATRGSVLYFVIADLAMIDPMYQYSLEYFVRIFVRRLEVSEASDEVDARLKILIEDITKSFYLNICRGLFEKDKLLYSTLNAVQILRRAGQISTDEWNVFLRGSPTDFRDKENKCPEFLPDKSWHGLFGLEECNATAFKDLVKSFEDANDKKQWRDIVKSETPWTCPMPAIFEDRLSPFQKSMIINVINTNKLIGSLKSFVAEELGKIFIESPPFDLEGCLEDSTNIAPIIFILSPGADPIAYLKNLAVQKEMDKKFESISLGQGQNKIAEKLIEEGSRSGMWICLQNCHLYTSWMGELEKIQEKADAQNMHPDYRLWLTSDPSKDFPVPVLQNGIKLTNEPPRGLKAGMIRTFNDLGADRYESCSKSLQYKKLVFALAYFHSAILERRKYGAVGWNVSYQWMNSDFDISERQLMMYLNEQPEVPYVALNYLVAQVNYGGRVTDDKDVRLINAMLKKYFCAEIMQDGYKFSTLDTYYAPPEGSLEDTLNYIQGLPLDEDPEVFGLHSNANMTFESNLVKSFVDTILLMQPRVSGGKASQTPEQIVQAKAKEFLEILPELIDMNKAHATTFAEQSPGIKVSLGVFIGQETQRFNMLLKTVKKNLDDLINAIKGTVVMSQQLEQMFNSFIDNKVPAAWLTNSLGYPSLKPLGSWVADLILRLEFVSDWIYNGPPVSFWLPAFFFPQGFMTATMQTYARSTEIAIDTLSFKTNILKVFREDIDAAPPTGVHLHGLFMQGAKWDFKKESVEDSDPKVELINFPVIWLEPQIITEANAELSPSENYKCPLYKTSLRAGELSTTGHSTNFVLYMNLPSKVHQDYWIRRGVALLCMKDD